MTKRRATVNRDIIEFEQTHQLRFSDKSLLRTAFVHSSYVNEVEDEAIADNERLEFLGDSVLGYVVSEALFRRFPGATEGQLTAIRAALVRRETLARYALQLDLGAYLLLGHGEEESGGRLRVATLCATFEAVIGALYLDQGITAVRQFVLSLVEPDLDAVHNDTLAKDPKSRLQEWSQSELGAPPKYRVVAEDGPDHAKVFTTVVMIGDRTLGAGRGRSKQEASQAAAAMALARCGLSAPEYVPDDELLHYVPGAEAPSD
jgi:ribonuclease-3